MKTVTIAPPAEHNIARRRSNNAIGTKIVKYGVEFFHIYTDELINGRHVTGLRYLQEAEKTWSFDREKIVLIDNYNPTNHVTTADDVLSYLKTQDMLPDHWAFEGDMVENAALFLQKLTDKKLRKNYLRYIEQHGKYPCSLLTATWYLTRLGYLPHKGIIQNARSKKAYRPATRLINFLPQDYKSVEERAHSLITKSEYSDAVHSIQNFFYPIDAGRAVDLF